MGEERGQSPLALDERHLHQAAAVQVQQVEGIENEVAGPPLRQGVLQRRERADAVFVLDHDLAVEQQPVAGQPKERGGQVAVTRRPVVAVAGEQADVVAVDPDQRPVAVELDLVQPLLPVGRGRRQRGELRRHELGKGRFRRRGRDDVGEAHLVHGRRFRGRRSAGAAAARRPRRRQGLHRPSRHHALRRLAEQRVAVAGPGEVVALLDQEPVLALALLALQPDQHPAAEELLAVEAELQRAAAIPFVGVLLQRRPVAVVPDDHAAGAVLAAGDGALEAAVVEGMVLDMDGEAPVGGIQAGPAGHRPALQGVAELQPEVVVQPPRGVLVDDEQAAGLGGGCSRRLGRPVEAPLLPIDLQGVRQRPNFLRSLTTVAGDPPGFIYVRQAV